MKASQWARRMPWTVVAAYLALLALGLSCIERAEQWLGTGGVYFRRQLVWSVLAVGAMVAATLPSYRILQRWSYVLFLASLPLLLAVFAFPAVNGSHRWISLGPVNVQPSEFAKLAFVLGLARYLMYRENYRRLPGMVAPVLLALVPTALVLKEPDLGTSLLFLPVLFVMLFAAGARLRNLVLVAGLGLSLVPLFWPHLRSSQRLRITSWLAQEDRGPQPRGAGYQLYQSKVMLAMGGVHGSWRQGDATDNPAAYRLPEARTDFIFSVVGERFGLVGCTATLVLFLVILLRGLSVASATREPFGRLVAVGLVALLGVQVLINTSMTVGLLPITGLTLPVMSYGGSSLLASGLAIGLLLNIAVRPGYEVSREPFR